LKLCFNTRRRWRRTTADSFKINTWFTLERYFTSTRATSKRRMMIPFEVLAVVVVRGA
jgi:hypothetical protein